jgi:hypothetical protein
MSFLRLPVTRLSTISITSRASIRPLTRVNQFSTTSINMAANTPTSNIISETAKQEGGPTQGSTSAQMQSEVGKTRNFEQAAQEVGSKMQSAPESITSEVCSSNLLPRYQFSNSITGRRVPEVSRSSCDQPGPASQRFDLIRRPASRISKRGRHQFIRAQGSLRPSRPEHCRPRCQLREGGREHRD